MTKCLPGSLQCLVVYLACSLARHADDLADLIERFALHVVPRENVEASRGHFAANPVDHLDVLRIVARIAAFRVRVREFQGGREVTKRTILVSPFLDESDQPPFDTNCGIRTERELHGPGRIARLRRSSPASIRTRVPRQERHARADGQTAKRVGTQSSDTLSRVHAAFRSTVGRCVRPEPPSARRGGVLGRPGRPRPAVVHNRRCVAAWWFSRRGRWEGQHSRRWSKTRTSVLPFPPARLGAYAEWHGDGSPWSRPACLSNLRMERSRGAKKSTLSKP